MTEWRHLPAIAGTTSHWWVYTEWIALFPGTRRLVNVFFATQRIVKIKRVRFDLSHLVHISITRNPAPLKGDHPQGGKMRLCHIIRAQLEKAFLFASLYRRRLLTAFLSQQSRKACRSDKSLMNGAPSKRHMAPSFFLLDVILPGSGMSVFP